MKVIVIGCGLLGISTAFMLRKRGCAVTVLERASAPAQETSYANGGLLVPSMAEPWNAPGVLRQLLRSWLGNNEALRVHPSALPGLMGWGAKFFHESSEARWRANTLKNVRLAMYSQRVLETVRTEINLKFDYRACGALKVFRDERTLERAWRQAKWLELNGGIPSSRLTGRESVSMEPALVNVASNIEGGIYYPLDAVADARGYCEALAEFLKSTDADLQFGARVLDLKLSGGRITSVVTDKGTFFADSFVLAAANSSRELTRKLGFDLPIRPAKGYSLTLEETNSPSIPKLPIIDDATHAVVVPLRRGLRVAGVAEFAGMDLAIPAERIAYLQRLLGSVFPEFARDEVLSRGETWTGLRAMSADGVPILGPTQIENLFLNTGHGHLGWTMAAGSGQAVADLIAGDRPTVDLADYHLARFYSGIARESRPW